MFRLAKVLGKRDELAAGADDISRSLRVQLQQMTQVVLATDVSNHVEWLSAWYSVCCAAAKVPHVMDLAGLRDIPRTLRDFLARDLADNIINQDYKDVNTAAAELG